VELVHCASLVFDDLPSMDDAATRRGAPAVHVRFGEGTAILAGLGLLTTAFGLLGACSKPRRAVSLGARYLGPVGLLTGQVLDLAAPCTLTAAAESESALREVRLRKTGALVQLALRLGGTHGPVTREQDRALSRLGREIGNAYQCVDDIQDLHEDSAMTSALVVSHLARAERCLTRGADSLAAVFPDSPARRGMFAFCEQLGSALSAGREAPATRAAAQ
jgi:geranylgeranyl pyrophosphate synthase